ncbi:ribonucleotide-diphosphate reductase subunit alpha, partial [mine drainage metagenome]
MEAVKRDGEWKTYNRTDHAIAKAYQARDLWRKLAVAAWRCGDPGVQFDDVTNDWHTCANSGRINASNPCSEYLFLDDTACNLASINL